MISTMGRWVTCDSSDLPLINQKRPMNFGKRCHVIETEISHFCLSILTPISEKTKSSRIHSSQKTKRQIQGEKLSAIRQKLAETVQFCYGILNIMQKPIATILTRLTSCTIIEFWVWPLNFLQPPLDNEKNGCHINILHSECAQLDRSGSENFEFTITY